MKLLFFVIFLSGSQGLAGLHASGLVKAEQAGAHEGQVGALTNGSSILGQAWSNLTVNRGNCYTEDNLFSVQGSVGESLVLKCHRQSRASLNSSITWKKNCSSELRSGESLIFQSLTTSDAGYYTCTWSFSNGTQVYTMSRTQELKVNEGRVVLDPKIIQPLDNAEIKVDVGKAAVVSCVVVLHSEPEFELIFWMKETKWVSKEPSEPVFYNETIEPQRDGKYHMIASLVFRRVTPEHLNTKYTCKLDSPIPSSINVSITLTTRGDAPSPFLWSGIVAVFAVVASVVTVIYVKLKIDIVLFLRQLRGASFSVKDGKQYDAYIMYYKAASEEALTEEEQRLIPRILETEFGYRLCLYERDILPGRAVPEAVLEHIGQSRRLVLLPGTLEAEHESWVKGTAGGGAGDEQGLLSGLHAALVDRQTRLILVERAPRGKQDSLPEPLQLLVRSGGAVAWRGDRSVPLSSPFWKKLRYHMPAQKSPKHRVESMTML
ncbi:hypothetical protein ANANG_G00061890 [Anguilla anguilla]|uniref:Uncharacterized protein n=1 Tax=Anguilla anguilla TaxID=7936 RepID=A0A9D3MP08_ANGAN|nr:hypothetical protein ANANG_G00061890 [Anguilla anguilla]